MYVSIEAVCVPQIFPLVLVVNRTASFVTGIIYDTSKSIYFKEQGKNDSVSG